MASLLAAHKDDSSSLVHRNKRRGVALSCAECRRLKLKCSRVFPCSNCVKKGCAAICPEGSLTTGKGNRFVLANTEVLHEKINQLANRVRHLEDALAESHSRYSEQPHHLLSDELLQIKRPLERERMNEVAQKEEKVEQSDSIDAMGSLSISQDGRSTFFGTTANSWYLLQNEGGSDDEDDSSSTQDQMIPADLSWLTSAFPFNNVGIKSALDIRTTITGYLPDANTARTLCDIYFRHASWMYTPITELDFFENMFRPTYDQSVSPQEPLGAHALAVLFLVLALGTLLKLDAPPHSPQAMQYYQLGRASLALESILEEQSIPAIQALLLMCHFMFLSEMGSPRWVIMGIVVKMAHSIGLHRDSGKWKLNPEETLKRRALFYELLTYDSWQSLTYGRPPSLSSAHIDTRFPHETTTNAQGEIEMSFAAWKHRFSALCLSVVHDQAFGARTPSYKVVTDLDKKVRNFYVPPSLQIPGFGGSKIGTEVERPTVQLTMQRYITFAIREMTLFYMHRGFFAQALEDNPNDPLGSKYSQSVLAAYGSACTFIGLIESLFQQQPELTERMWFLFTHVFSCSIVLGSMAIKTQMQLAPSALSYLETAYNLFSRVSDNTRTSKILPILGNLRERARAALSEKSSVSLQAEAARITGANPKIKSEVNELSALGGMTRLVARRSSQSPSYTSSPVSQPASPPVMPTEPVSPALTYQSSPMQEYQSWAPYTMNQGYGMEAQEYPSYQSVHGVVQQMNAGPPQSPQQHHQQHQQHQPHSHHRHQSSLSPHQQMSLQQQTTHSQQQMLRQTSLPSRMPQQHQHNPVLGHHHSQSMSMQQQSSPVSPQIPQQQQQQQQAAMYNGNQIQQLAGGVLPEFFGYAGANDYSAQVQMISSSPESTTPPDLNVTWYNFMSQFRQ
ncbi:hypothetical protein AGABI1DRAFT_70548 [Agaricus bisporus var. burnettii JB137-S8]|uniref:Zn(2)-C6 fungal-type domain-containing protein n=1 Tax=Agaricus bisporus var. burnettii (strain JB137-S8 / ATCC MYA-4627 / FGSC 10392) TaxID=597362 RepID=K5XFG0_AGABU|nr:hypothetical protein AGABI2DRAFT_223295 [Agaricus bisporus var. bisporus H97]XP_007327302.1 uncharacterized protein AGABI1DRAFT_70548 [Agaricus bisporus var. burnettii JB137-S8]EKM81972.1 hypothetical protein AGABI1DRAFT_70548 [Agaricus bisporus var. burnettii JB137-S8]EKV46776.1 hypothetical protein AGABI2DRAFT_223295 [Agaricus bisporus var. bisporus H97]